MAGRSKGQGGLGTTANVTACAVEGCEAEGKPQICPFDHRYHGHGAIHYGCGYPQSSLTFRKGDWYWICDEHYAHVKAEREAWVTARKTEV